MKWSLAEDICHLWKEYRGLFDASAHQHTFVLLIYLPDTIELYRTHGVLKSKISVTVLEVLWSPQHMEESRAAD